MAIISTPLGILLSFIYDIIGNYGLTLIIFTIIVRACLFPLYYDQMKHSTKLQDVQPKMQELQKKYGNNKEKLNQEMMELYKTEGVNPARGCLPMLIQFPVIVGLFSLLRNPIEYISSPVMLQAIHEDFLWVNDLAQPDHWILPILAGIATFFSLNQTTAASQTGGAANAMATMKMMKYIFPVMIVFWGRSFPAGLTIYWFVGTLVQVVQTFFMNRYKKKKAAEKEALKTA